MKVPLFLLVILSHSTVAFAQRDAPVYSSYLPRIAMFNEPNTLDFEITFAKNGGPYEQRANSQVYVLGYLEKDEARILELAADKKLTAKSSDAEKLLLDILVEEKLVVLLETKVATKAEARPVISGKTGRSVRSGSCFDFAFSFNNSELFTSIARFKSFNHNNDNFKLIIFVPVNDCRYATEIPKEQREFYDFAHLYDSDTIIQFFKPLPYRFRFHVDAEGGIKLFIN